MYALNVIRVQHSLRFEEFICCVYSYGVSKGHLSRDLPISVNHLPISVNELPISGNDLPISGNDLPISVNELPISVNQAIYLYR